MVFPSLVGGIGVELAKKFHTISKIELQNQDMLLYNVGFKINVYSRGYILCYLLSLHLAHKSFDAPKSTSWTADDSSCTPSPQEMIFSSIQISLGSRAISRPFVRCGSPKRNIVKKKFQIKEVVFIKFDS